MTKEDSERKKEYTNVSEEVEKRMKKESPESLVF